MSKLPPLPMPSTVWHASWGFPSTYSENQLREYGQQCRDAALDEAAKLVEADIYLSPTLTNYQAEYNKGIERKAAEIRNLK